MRLRHIEIVWAICRSGSMHQAARMLGISQPAMSQALRHAEDNLGFELFFRERGRLVPTPELRMLTPELEQVFGAVEAIRSRANAMARGQDDRILVAAIPTLSGRWLARAAMLFRSRHPRTGLSVVSAPTAIVTERVLEGHSDIGLLHGPVTIPGIRTETLWRNEVVAVLPRAHPLARLAVVTPRDLRNYDVLSVRRGTIPGDLIAAAFDKVGVPFSLALELTMSASAALFVREGLGVALLDREAAESSNLEDLAVRAFEPQIMLEVQAAWAADRMLSPAAHFMIRVLSEVSPAAPGVQTATAPAARALA